MHNPYNYHTAVDNDLFFGREKILDRLVSGLSAPAPLSAAIFGGRRCGKTSLINKLARVLRGEIRAAGDRRFLPCVLDLQEGRPLNSSDDFFLWVLEELGHAWERQRNLERGLLTQALRMRYQDGAARGPVEGFIQAYRSLDSANDHVRLVILVDESEDIIAVDWGQDLRPNLRYLLSNSPLKRDIALVLAGATQMYTKITERDSPLENILDRYPLPTLSREATLALARQPNDHRLPEQVAEEVYRQTGGHPCMAQYILHELWYELDGALRDATVQNVCDVAETFDDRTGHASTWTKTLGPVGNDVYRFLAEQHAPLTLSALQQPFAQVDSLTLKSTLDTLHYHGLIHCRGRGTGQQYTIAGQMFRTWFLQHAPFHHTQHPTATTLRDQLKAHFDSAADLEELCQDLDLDMRKMRRATVTEFILDIVKEAERQNKLAQIKDWIDHQMTNSTNENG